MHTTQLAEKNTYDSPLIIKLFPWTLFAITARFIQPLSRESSSSRSSVIAASRRRSRFPMSVLTLRLSVFSLQELQGIHHVDRCATVSREYMRSPVAFSRKKWFGAA